MRALLRLSPFVRPYWKQVLLAAFSLLALTAANLWVPYLIQQVIDVGLAQRDRAYLTQAAWLILGIGVARAGLLFARRYLTAWVAQRVTYDLRNRIYAHLQRLSIGFHDRTPSGQLISRTIEDVRAVTNFLNGGLVEILQMALMFVAALGVMFAANPRLALVASLPLIPLVLVATNFGQKVTHLFYRVDQIM